MANKERIQTICARVPRLGVAAGLLTCCLAANALAQEAQPPAPEPEAPAAAENKTTLSGYLEGFYSWNTNDPANGVTAYRGFDNRHNSFTISNAVVDVLWTQADVTGHVALQVGQTPQTYYLAEPSLPPAAGVGASNMDVWKYVQQANLGWRTLSGKKLDLEAGIFLSPIGPEGIAVKDNWNWSRSDLFYGLPFYHTGVRGTYAASDRLALTGAVYNGWNCVVENNANKSLSLQAVYTVPDKLTASVLYFGGVERSEGAPEGQPWRNLFDSYVTWTASPRASLQLQVDGGFEATRFSRSDWFTGALAGRVQAKPWLFVAARGDVFWETVAANDQGTASAIFWPVDRVSSITFTLDARPKDKLSVRLEYRHDAGSGPLYFGSDPELPNQKSQDTVTLGFVAWF